MGTKYSNQVCARNKLWHNMPAGDYAAEQAALDAMTYQCPNQQWKDRLMEGKITFQEAIDYGMTKLTAKQEGKTVGNGSVKPDSPVLPVDKLEKEKDTKFVSCGNCFEKHKARSCPAWGYQCS